MLQETQTAINTIESRPHSPLVGRRDGRRVPAPKTPAAAAAAAVRPTTKPEAKSKEKSREAASQRRRIQIWGGAEWEGRGGGATEQSDGRISNALPRVLSATTAAASSRQRRHRRRRSADSDRFATFSCPSQEAVSLERLPPAPVALNENTNPHRRRLFQCRRRRLNGSVLNLSDGFTQLIPRLWPVLGPGCRGTNSWMFTYVSLFVTCCFYHRFTFSLFSHVVTVVSRGIRVPTGIPTVDNLATVFWIRPMSLSST